MATLGGNLCQRPRCWYFRSPDFPCAKKGGTICYAIEGENQYHAIFGDPKCSIVHPSNLGPALVALEAVLQTSARAIPAEAFFQTDRIQTENALRDGEIITSAEVPHGARSAYLELREKQSFDWPLVSVAVARRGDNFRVVFGAVAPRPWRIGAVEAAVAKGDLIAARKAIQAEARPLSKNGYKVKLLQALLPRALDLIR